VALLHGGVREIAQGVWDFGKEIGTIIEGEEGEIVQQLVINEDRDKMAMEKTKEGVVVRK
jgi:hypothetical protein